MSASAKQKMMRKARYSGPRRSGVCVCGHSWKEHHLGVVMSPGGTITDGGEEIYIPQECEHYGFNEMGGLDDGGNPHCHMYVDKMDKCL